MKIAFLNPPFYKHFSRSQRSPAVTKGGTLYYPIWLAYAAGVSDKSGFETLLMDSAAKNQSVDDMLAELKKFRPDIIVIDSSTPSIFNDMNIAAIIKPEISNVCIVLVGTHPSALPEQTLASAPAVDVICIGEYDYTVRDLAFEINKKSSFKNVKGICFRENGKIIVNERRELIENLDEIPFAAYVYKKYLNVKEYYFAAADYPMAMIITGRGCPFKCFFCVYPQTFHSRRYRLRTPESVAEEFEYIKNELPDVKEVAIEDDTFTANRPRTHKICELLIKNNNKLKWYANVRADLDFETMQIMKSAGCRLLIVGFESGSNEVLKNMHKGISKEASLKFMSNAKKAGLLVHGCMMIGNPGETERTMNESYEFSRQLDCDSFQFYPLYVYPGTEAYDWAKTNGYLLTEDFKQWLTPTGEHNCVISLPGLPRDRIVEFCNTAYRRYHLNPRYILKKLFQFIAAPSEGKRTARSAFKFFKSFFR
ncbi:MAG TPA: radical SAM protein [bacterium]|nr:radical SAM protein [bacterium]HPN31612.1 radical SAM protein [bacterium]